ncbi:MAG TPA: ribosome assembly RNA-binding protein YhbY [Burkholderiaceae bacterium]|jgi:putative YhbY family RNA-binding protein|nr:ribosome assembly RNA-binding protein YhbY [Burkholderiaceae bacterium]
MAELTLTRDERLELRARAHPLNPVVLLGNQGLTEAVMKEIDRALAAHELIKVRVPGDDREQREAIYQAVAEALGAGRVQAIGKLLVLYRPRPPEEAPERSAKAPASKPSAPRSTVRKAATKATSGEIRRTERKVPPRRPSVAPTGRRGQTKAR